MFNKNRKETSKKRKPPGTFLSAIDIIEHRYWLAINGDSGKDLDKGTEYFIKTFK